jgi:NAD(P)H-hydrate epimerase
MRPVLADEMRRLDQAAILDFHIPSLTLMENAGRGVADLIRREFKPCRAAVFVGNGNNGGDGLVVARSLVESSFAVTVLMLGDPACLKHDPKTNFLRFQRTGASVRIIPESMSETDLFLLAKDSELIVDAIFGVGLRRDIQGVMKTAVAVMNRTGRPVVSIDIPSGLDADSGRVRGAAVKATVTATLAIPKVGLAVADGPEYCGRVEIIDIGMPDVLLAPYRD